MTIEKVLKGHVSEDTAYVVDDYPYGFRLRCKIRYWVETTKHGSRFCSQTTNPKVAGEKWNKPKKNTYSDLCALFINEEGHVNCWGWSIAYGDEDKFVKYLENFESCFESDAEKKVVEKAKFVVATRKKMAAKALEATNGASDNIYDVKGPHSIVFESAKEASEEMGNKLIDVIKEF
jgi:hypothetical protein